jgi:uncharacterized protein (TIGR02246 family)
MLRFAMIAACTILLAAPAHAQTKKTMQSLNEEWMSAFGKGDSYALAAMYAEDAYLLPAGADMVHGRQAIQSFWEETMRRLKDGSLAAVDVEPLGPDAAREIGTFSFKTKAEPSEEVTGKYVVVWRKVKGKWKLATDIWNMNK